MSISFNYHNLEAESLYDWTALETLDFCVIESPINVILGCIGIFKIFKFYCVFLIGFISDIGHLCTYYISGSNTTISLISLGIDSIIFPITTASLSSIKS